MKIAFDVRSWLPEGMGQPVMSQAVRAILGDELRVTQGRLWISHGPIPNPEKILLDHIPEPDAED